MACESARRQSVYLKIGCNAYHKRDPTSQPMSFWTEQDVLAYLKMTGIPYASVYGEIVEENGRLTTTGAKRTGCMFCMFGVHLEKKPNRFQRMALTHPKRYTSLHWIHWLKHSATPTPMGLESAEAPTMPLSNASLF